ncbi:MAG: hypothetical protein M5U10_10835 [Candidatus Methanoperedens sp.]|nr:hypothetical protein [Candidatus Methanoperedens sp.]
MIRSCSLLACSNCPHKEACPFSGALRGEKGMSTAIIILESYFNHAPGAGEGVEGGRYAPKL